MPLSLPRPILSPASGEALEEQAGYGRLPFDIFLQDRWDHNATGDNREQWERLVWDWESLTLMGRYVPATGVSGENKILDDPLRYDFDDGSRDSWRRLLVRMSGITDFHGVFDMDGDGTNTRYVSGQDDEKLIIQAQEGNWLDLTLVDLIIQAGLYLLDREAIESGLIKTLWLDEHGQISWEIDWTQLPVL
ncbi:hypothetical protein BJX96DRAFT_175370 [Aspergillus floccosus]